MNATPAKNVDTAEVVGHFINGQDVADDNRPLPVTNPATGQRLALFGPGQLLGQVAPLLGIPVISDVRMREDGVVLELGPRALERLLQPESGLSYRFVHAMVRALLGAQDRALRVRAREEQQRRLLARG